MKIMKLYCLLEKWLKNLLANNLCLFPMKTSKIKHGIIAYLHPSMIIVHFCGYKNEPDEKEFASLWEELSSDTEFGLVHLMKNVKLKMATPEQVEFYKKQM